MRALLFIWNKPVTIGSWLLLVFLHFTTHAQNWANGYKGIWFTLGQFSVYGDKYSGGLGTYTSSHIPVAGEGIMANEPIDDINVLKSDKKNNQQ